MGYVLRRSIRMKEILINRICDQKRKAKFLSIGQETQDKDSVTSVRKNFVYMLFPMRENPTSLNPPQIYIRKEFDHKNKVEKFSFRVKGYFFITHQEQLFKVRFRHCLNIEIAWKHLIFSPKKSAVLT